MDFRIKNIKRQRDLIEELKSLPPDYVVDSAADASAPADDDGQAAELAEVDRLTRESVKRLAEG